NEPSAPPASAAILELDLIYAGPVCRPRRDRRGCHHHTPRALRFRHIDGSKIRTHSSLVENQQTKERAILLDNDFFVEDEFESSEAETIRHTDNLHIYSGPFFRWCIQQKLHDSAPPPEVPVWPSSCTPITCLANPTFQTKFPSGFEK